MSLLVLLEAAEYLERREREMEHGYATTLPMPPSRFNSHLSSRSQRARRAKSKLHSNRTTHNELEKNRRAHLRTCLEKLKDKVPIGSDGARHTTLGLLNKAKSFIKNLEASDRKHLTEKESLEREHRYLKRRIELLGDSQLHVASKRRSVSESSVLSSASTLSTSSNESDEMDILGYGSNQSDSDDHSSVQSIGSDGGVTIYTRRLTLKDTSPIPQYHLQL